MPKIYFKTASGARVEVVAVNGHSVMEAARTAGIAGIEAECGGSCSCATCHVHVAQDWLGRVGGPLGVEADMLGFAEDVTVQSRLSCQIRITDELDGLEVTVASH
jgi:2Fe-2S ferredoxin